MKHRRTTRNIRTAPLTEERDVAANPVATASLYVVATPIGNLSDLSQRAISSLCQVAWVAAEDTRVTRTLLNHIGSTAQLISLHAHNEAQVSAALVDRLRAGESGALVSDAGTPAISDPGAILVSSAHRARIAVCPIPGPSAPITLLSASGLPPGPFLFEGFLPARDKPRKQRLLELKDLVDKAHAHLLFFEAPHRIEECITTLLEVFGPARELILGRELTKVFEEIHRCSLADAAQWIAATEHRQRGEFVLAIAALGVEQKSADSSANPSELQSAFEQQVHSLSTHKLLSQLLEDIPLSRAVKLAQGLTGIKHRDLYQLALRMSDSNSPEPLAD